jgi:hypothetical protein
MACLPLKFQSSYVLNNVRRGRRGLRVEIRHFAILKMCVRLWPAQDVSKKIPALLPNTSMTRTELICRLLKKEVRRGRALKQIDARSTAMASH